jgi:WD40 repeat protein
VAFSPDGKRLVSTEGTGGRGGTVGVVKVWDAAGGQELLGLKGHRGDILGASFTPDGRRLVTVAVEGINTRSARAEVKVWDATPRPAKP